jgi:hypothetical protein
MELMTVHQHYVEQRWQVTWIDKHDWQFAQPKRERRVCRAMAKGLVLLATRLAPPHYTLQTA